MGKIPEPEIQRDELLVKDYILRDENKKPVYSISELGMHYARLENGSLIPLTATRIHQILNKYNVKKYRVVKKKKKGNKILDKSVKKN